MGYNEYPKAMSHPAYKPAVLSQDTVDPVSHKTIKAAPGKPAQYPPVYVNNPDQEAQYASLGYVPNGVADAEAYYRATVGANEPNDHAFKEFPKWLYRPLVPGEYEGKLLESQEAQDALPEGQAWYATPGDAIEASYADEEEDAPTIAGELNEGQEEGQPAAAAPKKGRR